jgi:hypothetical protein
MARHNHAPSTSAKKASLPSAFHRHRNVHRQCNQDQYLHSEEEEEKEKRKKKTKVRGSQGGLNIKQYHSSSCVQVSKEKQKKNKKNTHYAA